MKTVLYLLAVATSIAAGSFSWSNIGKHQKQLDDTKALETRNANLETDIGKLKKELRTEKDNLTTEKGNLAETEATIENLNGKIHTLKMTIGDLDNEIAQQQEKIENVKKLIAKLEAIFDGQNLTIDEVPAHVEKLNEERKELSSQLGELIENVEVLQSEVDKNNSEITELVRRESARAKSLSANGLSSLITAVNNDWGFVIIKPHPDAEITIDSKLIVVRGTQHLGRLKINSVEPHRIIADVDYSSLVDGARIRAGDRVILSNARTR